MNWLPVKSDLRGFPCKFNGNFSVTILSRTLKCLGKIYLDFWSVLGRSLSKVGLQKCKNLKTPQKLSYKVLINHQRYVKYKNSHTHLQRNIKCSKLYGHKTGILFLWVWYFNRGSTVDIIFFCSLNPLIDIGQIEGGFMMGLGYHLMEDFIYDVNTGRILNDGTWVCVHPVYWYCIVWGSCFFLMGLSFHGMKDICLWCQQWPGSQCYRTRVRVHSTCWCWTDQGSVWDGTVFCLTEDIICGDNKGQNGVHGHMYKKLFPLFFISLHRTWCKFWLSVFKVVGMSCNGGHWLLFYCRHVGWGCSSVHYGLGLALTPGCGKGFFA